MSNTTDVFILAAGDSVRFKGVAKQLLDIDGERCLDRIVRQVNNRRNRPTVVTHLKSLHPDKQIADVYVPISRETTCDTLLSTLDAFSQPYKALSEDDRFIILLGDVVYSKALMDAIFSYKGDIRVFGNTWEIFAISFTNAVTVKVAKALDKAKSLYPSKLRTFYRVYSGVPLHGTELEHYPDEKIVFHWWMDWSNDMDDYEKYRRFVHEVVNADKLDDRP